MKYIYGILCILGFAFPAMQLLPWINEHGFSLMTILNEIRATGLGLYAWTDKILASVALFVFVVVEGGGRLRMRCILPPVLGTILIGPAFGLPLFLLMREFKLDQKARSGQFRQPVSQVA